MRKSKDIIEEHVKTIRNVGLTVIMFAFGAAGAVGFAIALERHLEYEAKVCQEACVKW